MKTLRLTHHAIERYQERVAPAISSAEARMALQRFVSMGRMRPTPRRWMSSERAEPGTRFVYWSRQPGVCAILLDGAVVTVITAELVRTSPRRHLHAVRPARKHQLSPVERWRWDRRLDWQDDTFGEAA